MRRLFLASAALVAAQAISAPATAKPEFARPPYAGIYEPQGKDERGLWMAADEFERNLRDSPAVLRNPKINDWLRKVLCRTIGNDRCSSVRIYVVRDSSFNASMAPNGMMIVHTGLLVRLHSEAELATVLGHEFGHFEKRHGLAELRARRGATNALAWITMIGIAASQSTVYTQQNITFAYFDFGRSEETEADVISSAYINGSPYRHRSAGVWIRIVEEDDSRRIARGLKPGRAHTTGWLDSHPAPLTRANYLAAIEAESKEGGEEGVEAYASATAEIMPELYEALVKGNDFGGAEYVLRKRGELSGENGQLLFARAELYRLRGNPRDLVVARDLFSRAAGFNDAPPEVWRGLGLCEVRLGNAEAGKVALKEYLNRNSSAKDAESISMLLGE